MIISKAKKFIFIHIKKTAGSSITRSLGKYDDRNLYLKVLNTKLLTRIKLTRALNPLWHHVTACEVKNYLGAQFSDYYSFAFVRNPFDWQVSNYFYIRQHPLHPRYREVKEMKFNEYLEWTHRNNRIHLQSDFVKDCGGRGDTIVNYIGKFESLDEDFDQILAHLGLRSDVKLDLHNASTRNSDYRSYYDAASIKFIEKHYEEDLERFGYVF